MRNYKKKSLIINSTHRVYLDSFRISNYINASLHYLVLGKKSKAIAATQAKMHSLYKQGSKYWFENANGSKYFNKKGKHLCLKKEFYFCSTASLFDKDLYLVFIPFKGNKSLRIPINKNRMAFFSKLLPLLNESVSISKLKSNFDSDENQFIDQLAKENLLKIVPLRKPPKTQSCSIQLVGHSCLSIESPSGVVLIDPLLVLRYRGGISKLDILRKPVDAIFITHPHWDHFNIDTLLHFDRSIKIIVPENQNSLSIVNLDLPKIVKQMGFKNIVKAKQWKAIHIGDLKIIPTPFYGETCGPQSKRDWLTCYFELNGKRFFCATDTCKDSFGNMDKVISEVTQKFGSLDGLFAPCSGFYYPKNQFTRMPFLIEPELEQYSGMPEDVRRWANLSKAKFVIPYAMFSFKAFDVDQEEIDQFRRGSISKLKDIMDEFPIGPLCVLQPYQKLTWKKSGPINISR